MMRRVVDHVVEKIAGEQPGKDRGRDPAEHKQEQPVNDNRERDADDRRHDQPGRIFRIIVMHSVQQKMELFPPSALWLIMKSPSMNRVFRQAPNKKSEHE